MKKNLFFLLFFASLFLISCNSDDELKSGGTLKITASTGVSKILSNYKFAYEQGCFGSEIGEPTSTDNLYVIEIWGYTDAGLATIYAQIPTPTIQTGKTYTYVPDPKNHDTKLLEIYIEDWIETDSWNTTKATIEFSKFQYPGRITGIAICYDEKGKVVSKGEFDFVSAKPSI